MKTLLIAGTIVFAIMTTPAFAVNDEQDAGADNTVAVNQMSGEVKTLAFPADRILPDSFGSTAHDRKPAQNIPQGVSHRKLVGSYLICARIKARVNVQELILEHL